MTKISYLAVLEKGKKGYGVYFPDLPGCTSWGKNVVEAQFMAKEALELHIYGMERDGEKIPKPSKNISDLDAGDIVVLITAYPDLFKDKHENKKVRTNITLPLWLKTTAENQGINFSETLEAALREKLA